ncbi:uncharacterized protein [Venturia canescens]|uniref:uncharacterized protein n=1 Tax=Venturia canescens TaxID=32260 RepID=UPI001C9D34BD|nr:uncharacterized protein LOC122413309 [Venturia canescens]
MSLHTAGIDIVASVVNESCFRCGSGPPPNSILHIPPPPIPTFLQYGSNVYSNAGVLINLAYLNNSLCKHSCNWRTEGVQYVEMPHKGTLLDDTWLPILISSCVGVIFVGLVLAAFVLRYKFSGSVKNSSMSITPPTSCTESKNGRMQSETILYPCAVDNIQDSRLMWATLTPRGTMRHYLEEHTYETIANGSSHKHNYSPASTEHMYTQPSSLQPVHRRSKAEDKSFDNTAFIDYEEPLSLNSENYQPTDDDRESVEAELNGTQKSSTLRPRVSSPTRIEHPNLPPLNLYPKKYGSFKPPGNHQQTSDTLFKGNGVHAAKSSPTGESHKQVTF